MPCPFNVPASAKTSAYAAGGNLQAAAVTSAPGSRYCALLRCLYSAWPYTATAACLSAVSAAFELFSLLGTELHLLAVYTLQ